MTKPVIRLTGRPAMSLNTDRITWIRRAVFLSEAKENCTSWRAHNEPAFIEPETIEKNRVLLYNVKEFLCKEH